MKDSKQMVAITDLFEESVARFPRNVYLWEKKTERYEGATYTEVKKQVYRFAAGLMHLGIQKGDRIALISEGRNQWVIAELGILYAGAINVPLSVKLNDSSDLSFRLTHAACRMIIASGSQAKKLKFLKNELAFLEKVILLDEVEEYDNMDLLFRDVMRKGDEYIKTHKDDFEARWKSIKPEDYANICYTSGTTADPKGIILTHRNYTANVEQAQSLMTIPESYVTLLILPWDHAFGHTACIYTMMKFGASLASVQIGRSALDSLKNIPLNIKEIKPDFILSVPALAKNFRKSIENGIREKGRFMEGLFNHALKIAYLYNGMGWDKGKGWKIILRPYYNLFDKILFSKIRMVFGGKLKFFIGGGALLDIELQRFFYAIGIPMFQGYGLSEASPIISSNSEQRHKLGSSGYLVSDMILKICDDKGNEMPTGEKGEIVIKGENVMAGYWNNNKSTEETIIDGWLHTGDMGYMDKDGFLYVLGRFKSLLIADDGEKYSPEGIEETFMDQSKFIDQCMLYNNQNPYTVCLLVPNKDALKRYAKAKSIDISSERGIISLLHLLESELLEYRNGGKYAELFPPRWLPSTIAILDEPFTEENHLLNSTMKMVRGKIVDRYKNLLDFLYTPPAKDFFNKHNIDQLRRLLK
jgi:long-chain acyl-CoA synthetase